MQEHHSFIEILLTNAVAIMAPILAFFLALIRTAKAGKVDFLEAAMCALLTVAAWGGLQYLQMPESAAVMIGGFIGGLGSSWAREWMQRKADKQEEPK